MPQKALKIIFMGTPDFSSHILYELITKTNHEICAIYTQPPRPKGRGHKVQKSPVHGLAEKNNIPVYTPKTLKEDATQKEFAEINADVAVVAAYGLLLPAAILAAPRFGCLNVHASLLPRWRGASPIQHAIWKGDKKSGVTIMQMDKGMDTGDMIVKGEIALGNKMSAANLHDELAKIGAGLVIDVLETLALGKKLSASAQDDALATYASLLKKEDGQVIWNETSEEISRRIRALNPWPGVWTYRKDGARFKILEATISKTPYPVQEAPGTLLNKRGEIMCNDGSVLKITKIQPQGKKPMDFTSALNGNYLVIGDVFE